MTWYETIVAAHLAVTSAVSHGGRMESERYFVWMEDGAHDLIADDTHVLSAVTGRTDLFTKTELDPWSVDIGVQFDAYGISWRLYDVEYEPDTGFWHWTWDWEVAADG